MVSSTRSTGNNDAKFKKKSGCLNHNTFAEKTLFYFMSAAGQKKEKD